jgi:hypothetical protein
MSTKLHPQLTQKLSSLDKVIELGPGSKTVVPVVNTAPNVDWDPVISKHLARTEALVKLNLPRETSVPDGFPTAIDAPWAWSGAALKESDYVLQLSEVDIKEINSALTLFKSQSSCSRFFTLRNLADITSTGKGSEADDVTPGTFALPGLETRLRGVADDLHNGRGFTVIRGLDPEQYSAKDNVIVYLGITQYIAATRGVQNNDGNLLSMFNVAFILIYG